MFFVYILYSKSRKSYYIGATKRIEERMVEHNKGLSRSTKAGIPWDLIYSEKHGTMSAARAREKFFKSGKGREARKQLLPR